MTPRQIDLARHALGLSKHQPVSYRNRFIACPNTTDFEDWQSMVDAGVAKRLRRAGTSTMDGGNVLFWLTRSGAEAALRPGESLCPEDFPAQSATPTA